MPGQVKPDVTARRQRLYDWLLDNLGSEPAEVAELAELYYPGREDEYSEPKRIGADLYEMVEDKRESGGRAFPYLYRSGWGKYSITKGEVRLDDHVSTKATKANGSAPAAPAADTILLRKVADIDGQPLYVDTTNRLVRLTIVAQL